MLTQQKYRKENNVFIAEGDKIALEWLRSHSVVQMVVATESWAETNRSLIDRHDEATLHIVEPHQLEAVSALQTPHQVLLVVQMPAPETTVPNKEWCIALDDIRDPGNMGTIIRIADWFGIKHIACSPECVDIYNPKVVQAAMGSHLRVHIHVADLPGLISKTGMPVYAAALDGENVYHIPKPDHGILLVGNESKGISDVLLKAASHRITIPRYGGAESLNAAVSTGIICALFMER